MIEPISIRRMVENEVVFRGYNERVKNGFDELKKIAEEDGQSSFITDEDTPLQFYCECADENCRKRISLSPSRYAEIHKQRDHFVIVPGHEVNEIEHTLRQEADYSIVKKHVKPPEFALGLQTTEVDNT